MKPGLALPSLAAVAVVCTLPALSPLLSGTEWWIAPTTVVVAVVVSGAVHRASPLTQALLPLTQAVVTACAITAMFTSSHALAGFVPTPESVEALLSLIDDGRARMEGEPAPLAPRAEVSVILTIAFGLVAIVTDFLAVTVRAPALTALPLAGPLLAPLAVAEHGIDPLRVGLAAAGYLALLAVDTFGRATDWGPRRGPAFGVTVILGATRHALVATGVSATALALALLVPLATPHLSSSAIHDLAEGVRLGGQTVTTTHPMVSLRRDLSSPSDREVLEYRTSASQPGYLRTYVLDEFDGESWTMSSLTTSPDNRVTSTSPLPPAPGNQTGERVTTEITLADRARVTDFLPAPYAPREIEVAGDWFADPDSLMIFSTRGTTRETNYVVTSERPDPAPGEVADTPSGGAGVDDRFLDVPDDTSPSVAETTSSVIADSDTPHERAVALQEWFTSDGRFEYDLRPPPIPDGADPLSHFLLESRVGFCEQFAAAMTVMARQAGIPARVAVGYTSGEHVSGDTWRVTESDAHAWPELYFEGQGWLRFEPTPSSAEGQGSATVPEYTAPARPDGAAPDETPGTGDAAGEPPPEGSPTPEASEESEPDVTDGADDAGDSGSDGTGGTRSSVAWPLALVILALLSAPALVRAAVRRARLAVVSASVSAAPDRARAAFTELRDDLVDMGLPRDPAESPRALADRLAADHELDGAALEALWRVALAEESARYAPVPQVGRTLAADLATVRAGLRTSLPRPRRILAVLAPRSLLRLPRPPQRHTSGGTTR
ncbi:transglutaminase TgpA family protein [Halostreptopolyspora alba]|uniref:Transglutaminase domain-containing protein n=1 Tax=Halostreptopolyspora alba TaxID=2487137 RepID=A0A3N0EF06_9ACTN|nr:transglutaminase domain-containing protein [Nocardiopsaceae bacterium YIM 96095]